MIDSVDDEIEYKPEDCEDNDININEKEDDIESFKLLLMQENLSDVSKIKKYKTADFRRNLMLNQLNELRRLSELSKFWVSVPYYNQSFNYPVISVDSSKAGSNTDVLRLAINDLGWREYPNNRPQKSCHVIWNSCNFSENKSNAGAFVNKFPGISQCLHKVGFTRILETMRTLFPEHYSFYPQTWYLPHQMMEFVMHCKNSEAEHQAKEKYYIVKPDAGTQGEGIYLIRRPQEYRTSSRNHVVQEYLADPLLLDGYKFDLRIYVVILGLDPLRVYLCNEGLARFCTQKYFLPTTTNHGNTFMHLTNYSLNKKSNQFIHTQKMDSGSKRTLSSVFAAMESNGRDVGKIWKRLEELVYKTVLAMVPQLKVHYITEILSKVEDSGAKNESSNANNKPQCFQILGFDVLIMDDSQPLLLEVNSNPSLRLDCEMEMAPGICEYYLSRVDIGIKRPLVKDTLKLLEREIADKFKIEMRNYKDSDCIRRGVSDIFPITKDESFLNTLVDTVEIENFEDLVDEWDMDADFGPFFTEIAKQYSTLPQPHFLSRPNSVGHANEVEDANKLESDSQSPLTSQTRSDHITRQLERLARERSWLNVFENDDNAMYTKNDGKDSSTRPKSKSAKSRSDSEPKEESCLRLISSKLYKSIYDKLRILEETTVIFFHAMGHRCTENIGATAFRTFGRRCKLHLLGFNHAIIDLIYIDVQRRWSFLSNYESKHGLCYQAFLEAFFRIAFARFVTHSKRDAVQSLIEHCKVSIGVDNFYLAKALFPVKESILLNRDVIRNDAAPPKLNRTNHSIFVESSLSQKSSSSEISELIHSKKDLPQKLTKYDMMKALHQIYRQKIRIPKSSKLEEMRSSDSDSGKSLPPISDSTVKDKGPNLTKSFTIIKRNESSNVFRTYRYESPPRGQLRQGNDDESKKPISLSKSTDWNPRNKTDKNVEKNDNVRPMSIMKEQRRKLDNRSKLALAGGRQAAKQWLPMNNERMMKIISAYGGKDLLKTSLNEIRLKYGALKPV